MEFSELRPIVEAMIFVSEEPITLNSIALALADDGIEKDSVKECIGTLEKEYNESTDKGIMLCEVAGGYQFRTKENFVDWLKRLNVPKPVRLSSPALETLAIIAYKQPTVRSEIEKIRGVDSGGVLKTLLERRLLRIIGRKDEPGQPLLYGTTKDFLEIFNLKNLRELPTLKDIEELLKERRHNTETPENILAQSNDDDDEEPTEVIRDDGEIEGAGEEEETEIIRTYPLEENVEAEGKDMEALGDLEDSLKDLRKLEKNIFPKPTIKIPDIIGGEQNGVSEITATTGAEQEKAMGEEDGGQQQASGCDGTDEGAGEDAFAEDDSPRD